MGVKIVSINDQLLPLHETDCEQIASMMSALGTIGADAELWLPSRRGNVPQPSLDRIASYYDVASTFRVRTFSSVFPAPRWLEKLAHPFACLRALRSCEGAVVYTRNIPMALLALKYTKSPVVYETYRRWPRDYKITKVAFSWMVKHPRLAAFVTHSALAARAYLELGLPAQTCLVSHNGFDPARLTPILSKAEARQALGLPLKGPIVTYTGHINIKKGLGMVLDLAAALPESFFVLVGSQGHGEVEERAQSMANVKVIPWLTGKGPIPYLHASDVLLIPPTSGPLEKVGNTVLPIKTFQYLASGRAIVAPATEDVSEVLQDDHNAVLLRPDDLDEARTRLQNLLLDPERMKRLGDQAKADSARYTWVGRAQSFMDFLSKSPVVRESTALPVNP